MIFNVTAGGGAATVAGGATLTVIAPAGANVTLSKDGKSRVGTADSTGHAIFQGLEGGTWLVTIDDGGVQTASQQVVITSEYTAALSYLTATITVEYPAGAVCTCSDGTTTLTAPGTGGSCTFTVNNTGAWMVKAVNGDSVASKLVHITVNGQREQVKLTYWAGELYDDGNPYEYVTGGWYMSDFDLNADGTGSMEIQEHTIYLNASAGEGGGATTRLGVDMTAFTTLHAIVEFAEVLRSVVLAVGAAFPAPRENNAMYQSIHVEKGKTEVTLDITNVTGVNKVHLTPFTTTNQIMYIHKVWLT